MKDIRELATETQARYLDAVREHGSQRAAARALGVYESAIRGALQRLNRKASVYPRVIEGFEPAEVKERYDESGNQIGSSIKHKPAADVDLGEWTTSPIKTGADGFNIKKISANYDGAGNHTGHWVKLDVDASRRMEMLKASVENVCRDLQNKLPPVQAPKSHDSSLLSCIPLGDPHFGLQAHADEVGENFDLKIAEQITFDAVDRLCEVTPSSDTGLLLNLGDFFHADDSTNRTPQNKNQLDIDSRYHKIADVGLRSMIRCIRRMLEKHKRVIVRNNRGNHDPHQSYMLGVSLACMFHDEPRVHIDRSPGGFFYHRFGKTLIGSTHGDGPKLQDLPLIMAHDVPADWAEALYRVWHVGHVHHDTEKEYVGCGVLTHRTMAVGDAWHNYQGYRSGRDMKSFLYDHEYGEVGRFRCNARMVS